MERTIAIKAQHNDFGRAHIGLRDRVNPIRPKQSMIEEMLGLPCCRSQNEVVHVAVVIGAVREVDILRSHGERAQVIPF